LGGVGVLELWGRTQSREGIPIAAEKAVRCESEKSIRRKTYLLNPISAPEIPNDSLFGRR